MYMCVILCSLCSCLSDKRNHVLFESPNTELQFEEMDVEPLLGNPYQLEIIDSILIIADYVDENALLLYHLNDSSYQRRLLIGEGPQDVIPPLSIDVDENQKSISVLQRQTGDCRKYVLDDLLNTGIPAFRKYNLELSDRMVETNDGYAYMGFDEKGVLLYAGENGSVMVIDKFEEYEMDDPSIKYKLTQGRISFSKKNNSLLYAPSYMSDIKMYTCQSGKWSMKEILSIGNGKVEKRIKDGDFGLYRDDVNYCVDICKTEDYFYVLYDGSELGGRKKADYHYVMSFDMEGNLTEVYKVISTVCDICVSEDEVMYALMYSVKDGEPIIGKAVLR